MAISAIPSTSTSPCSQLILQRLPATALLMGDGAAVRRRWPAPLLGIAAALASARRWSTLAVTLLAVAGYAMPVFWSGLLLLLLFASVLPWFPSGGMVDVGQPSRQAGAYVTSCRVLHHLVLPAFTLGVVYMAQYSRQARAAMQDVLRADYIRTARAKGMTERTVVFKHALRNAVSPVVTLLGLQFSEVLGGAVLVETVFGWPGMGRLVFDSILRRDYPTLLGVSLSCRRTLVMAAKHPDRPAVHRCARPAHRGWAGGDGLALPGKPGHGALRCAAPSACWAWRLLVLAMVVLASADRPGLVRRRSVRSSWDAPFSRAWGRARRWARITWGGTCWPGCWWADAPAWLVGLVAAALIACRDRRDRGRGRRDGRGGWVDSALMKATEFFQVLPALLFAMVLVSLFGARLSIETMAIGLASWTGVARLARAECMRLREMDYVRSTRAAGASPGYLVVRLVLPNALPPIIVSATLAIGVAILFEGGLSFLGLGDPNVMTWGLMLGQNRSYLQDAWWAVTFPGAAIFVAVLAVSLLGDGVNDALDPRLRRR